jgi:hypothetical protein
MHPICRVTSFEHGVLEVSGRQRHSKGCLLQELPAQMRVTEHQHQRHFLVWGKFLMIPSRYHEENEKVTVGT